MVAKLTHIAGHLDLDLTSKYNLELSRKFLEQGHITFGDCGNAYDLSDVIGAPSAIDIDTNVLVARLFDGPDRSVEKSRQVVKHLSNNTSSYCFIPVIGRTADGTADKLRVALVTCNPDDKRAVDIVVR